MSARSTTIYLATAALLAGCLSFALLPERSRAADCTRTSLGLTPIDDLGEGSYQDAQGGLYPGGGNERPSSHEEPGQLLADAIVPLDASGNPDGSGRYALISVGMSNTTQEFQRFVPLASADPGGDPQLAVVDGAQGGMTADDWADPSHPAWGTLDGRLAAAGLTPQQVAIAWVKVADAGPTNGWPAYAQQLQSEMTAILHTLTDRYPNLRLAYVSSRIYAGYASTSLNPEPYAYESGFAVKWAIEDQLAGSPSLNWDPEAGPVESPWLSWGPYLWADGLVPRSDGLTWACSELASDGTHPSASGASKVAGLLLDFFKQDSTARLWFNAENVSERDVSLKLRGGSLTAKGRVEAVEGGFVGCAQRVPVKIQRKGSGAWKTVGRDRTSPEGRYRERLKDRPGSYRAKARKARAGESDDEICRRASSAIREH